MKTHKDLDAWKRAMLLAKLTYETTARFPRSEVLGLTGQMRRAAVSIPSSIAEGAARQYRKEFVHFLYIALGSAAELDTQNLLALDLGFLKRDILGKDIADVKMLISGLIRYLKGDS